jgi:DNA-binding MarR family transcriptional regulator
MANADKESTGTSMSNRELIGFNKQIATVIIEHKRLLSRFIKTNFQVTYSEFTVLFALLDAAAPMRLSYLCGYLILSRKTILTIASQLEDKCLVAKTSLPEDKRVVLVSLTGEGKRQTRQIFERLADVMGGQIHKSLPEQDFHQYMMPSIGDGVKALGSVSTVSETPKTAHTGLFTLEHFIYWRAISEKWSAIVREEGRLTFHEFGLLALLNESGDMNCLDIADTLLIPASSVSLCKRHLLELSLVEERRNCADARKVLLRITAKGQRLTHRLKEKLNAFTQQAHGGIEGETATIINAWYFRMYSNIKANWRTLLDN